MSNVIGEMISKYRSAKGLSQQELAIEAGISRVSVGNYERGTRVPNAEVLSRIAKALNVSIKDLIANENFISKEEMLIRHLIDRTSDQTITWSVFISLRSDANDLLEEEKINTPDEKGIVKTSRIKTLMNTVTKFKVKPLRCYDWKRSALAEYEGTRYVFLLDLNEAEKKHLLIHPLRNNLEFIQIDNNDFEEIFEELAEVIFHQAGIGYDHTLSVLINSLEIKQDK